MLESILYYLAGTALVTLLISVILAFSQLIVLYIGLLF